MLEIKNVIDNLSNELFSTEQVRILDIGIGQGDFIHLFKNDYITYGMELNAIKGLDYNKILNNEIIYNNIECTIDKNIIHFFI